LREVADSTRFLLRAEAVDVGMSLRRLLVVVRWLWREADWGVAAFFVGACFFPSFP